MQESFPDFTRKNQEVKHGDTEARRKKMKAAGWRMKKKKQYYVSSLILHTF